MVWIGGGGGAVQARNIYIYIFITQKLLRGSRQRNDGFFFCGVGLPYGCSSAADEHKHSGKAHLLTRPPHSPHQHLLLVRLAAASPPDGHRLAVLVEAPPAAVDVGVSGGRHRLLPRPDGFGWEQEVWQLTLLSIYWWDCSGTVSITTEFSPMSTSVLRHSARFKVPAGISYL